MFNKKVTRLSLIIGIPLLVILALMTAFHAPTAQAASGQSGTPNSPAATFITTVDTGTTLGDAGRAGSVALKSNGVAVISYWDMTAGNVGDLKVAFCNDLACSNPTIQTVGVMDGARTTSVALTGSDAPVISYPGAGTMNVAFCNNATDCSSPITKILDTAASGTVKLGSYNSLAINSNGIPAISYDEFDGSANTTRLKVAICQDATCNSVTTRVVDGDGTTTVTGEYNSLALTSSDVPVISYAEASNTIGGRLMIATCESATDCSAPTINIVDDSGSGGNPISLLGQYTSLALNNSGFPIISYHEERLHDLQLAVCSDALCSSPVFTTTVDSVGDVGEYTSLALNSSGFPVISYVDLTNTALKLATCNDAACSSPILQTLDNAGAVGQYASLALNSTDGPAVSYYDVGNKDLKLYYNTTGCNTNSWTANNETSLNAAIGCYNAKTVAGTYTITVTQNISLTASTTAIDNVTGGVNLVIEGGGFAVDGQDISGVRPFDIATDTTVTMNQLTVTSGNIPSDQGGGIFNAGTLTINSSTISDNSALAGGGIENRGTLSVFNSTISGNSTSGSPGGGGIANGFGSVLTLDSVTISANSDTSATSAGGLWNGNAAVTLRNSILAGNSGTDCDSLFGFPVTDGGHNLVVTQVNCGLTNGVNGTIVGVPAQLGPLANNGGGTFTHSLLAGSPAIDAGDTLESIDQRGEARPFGLADDIGAFELQTCFVDSWSVANEAELNAAIACYNTKTASGSYTITVTQDISLTASATTIDNSTSGVELAIEGSGFAVDGQDNFDVRPFYVQSSTTVTINDLTITGGNKIDSGVENRGGGILNRGNLTLNRSTVISNTAETRGGGLATQGGTVAINDSTIAYNISGTPTQPGNGGGLYNENGQVTIHNSTISGNESDGLSSLGGGIANYHNMTLESVTITDNGASDGGGIYFNTTSPVILTIKNSILAGNGFDDCYFETISGGATINDLGYNLVQADNQLQPCGFVGGVNNNIVSVPFLLPLADNGGSTQTHALELDSPAVDAGDTSLPADQRGLARPQGATDDIGAFESTWCSDDSWSVTRPSQLDAAIACFNAKTNPGTYTINITQGFPAVASTTPIDNSTSGVSLVIEGGGNSVDWNGDLIPGTRPFHIMANTTVTINDFTIQNGYVIDEQGGAIKNDGTLTLNDSSILGSQAQGSSGNGGGIHNDGTLTVVRTIIDGNSANNTGGGINNRGNLTVIDSTISGNSATQGAGIYNNTNSPATVSATVSNSTISGNSAGTRGGGIYNTGTPMTVRNSTISGNTAVVTGGGVHNTYNLTLDSVTITGNTAGDGGALYNTGSIANTTVENSILANSVGTDDCVNTGGGATITDGGHNLVETQSACGFTDGVNGNIVGSDPMLDTLADNGGATKTHALLTGSPAIDAGDTAQTTDQRGVVRPQGLADDIGAYEAQVGSITITKDADPADDTVFNFGIIHENNPFPDLFTLQDPSNPSYTDSGLPVATYLVAEVPMDGWALSAIQCQSTLGTSNFSLALFGVSIELASGDDVTCTFVNECPMPNAPDIDISRSGTQVELAWITAPASSGYNVYRSSNDPYFTPMLPAYANPAISPWLDPDMTSIGDVANNYFYVVQTTTDCNESAESNRVGEFDFTLVPGTP